MDGEGIGGNALRKTFAWEDKEQSCRKGQAERNNLIHKNKIAQSNQFNINTYHLPHIMKMANPIEWNEK
jgi:hypothetical protein